MSGFARIAVVEGPRELSIRELPLPVVGDDDGLLEVEVNGICGSDAEFYEGVLSGYPSPMTIGHEPVGRVVELGKNARAAWGVDVGDRVVVNSALRCGTCVDCVAGRDCRSRSYGTLSPDLSPGLWGGIATHLYLAPQATLVPLAEHVSTAAAAFHNPLANGFEWTDEAGHVTGRSRVVVQGAGPRGFACALVALYLGAEQVTMVALERDRERLALAETMGVHQTLIIESSEDSELRDLLDSAPTVVIDTSPHSLAPVRQALQALDKGGRLVLAGIKGGGKKIDLEIDFLVNRRLTLVAPWSKSLVSLRRAVEAVESGKLPLANIPTRAYTLDRAAEAIESLSSSDPGRPLQVRVEPNS